MSQMYYNVRGHLGMIEAPNGDYVGEDDIVRFEDAIQKTEMNIFSMIVFSKYFTRWF